jgi:hypothetical protein
VHAAFGTVLWIVCISAIVIALIGLATSRRDWEDFGKNGGGSGSAASLRERDEEIRQMLEARNARRLRRGEEPLDIEDELRRLTAPAIDPGLRSEIRDLVIARNYRRTRAGKAPLDVEVEVEREVAKLSEGS